MEKKMKIAYLVSRDPHDKRSWSGINYSCLQQLERYADVDIIIPQRDTFDTIVEKIYKAQARLQGKFYNAEFLPFWSKRIGRKLSNDLANKDYDAVFMIGAPLGSYLKTNIPILYYSDATYHLMLEYYYKNLSPQSIRHGNELQKLTLQNNTINMFASEWARQDAINFYGIPADKCIVGHFGANVDTGNFQKAEPEEDVVNLLFVGVEWQRKGGDVAVECVRYLNKVSKDKKFVLHLVGIHPPYEITDEFVKVYGFLNRNIPEQAQQMIHLREIADLFVLPTRAECAGIVFCESSAYGIPSITYDTGGIGSYVVNGENGYRLPMTATGKDFADKILDILADGDKLAYMKQKAVEMYKDHMNWDALGDKIYEVIMELKKKK